MSLTSTIKFIIAHPLNRGQPVSAMARFLIWQIQSRLQRDIVFSWIEISKLVVRRGMTGATGNIYCGLHEYEDMSFLLHLLQPGDLFVDVGANIGSYTVLASKVCGARSIAIEPDADTTSFLNRNIKINDISSLVEVEQTAVGAENGTISFTVGKDTTNQVAFNLTPATPVQTVPLKRLDDILGDRSPTFLKLDVEGYELEALKGAQQILANPSLLAIEIETVEDDARQMLEDFGYTASGYDPKKRNLMSEKYASSSNALFVRRGSDLETRLAGSPKRRFRGKWV